MFSLPVTGRTRVRDLVPPDRLGHLSGLDGLRAIAVMAVVFYHADFTWAQGGFLGVEVFFVISGYLITSLLLVEWLRTDTIDFKAFWLRRARRLLPALFLVLGAVAIGSILFLRDSLYRVGGDILAASTYVTNWFQILRQESYFETFGRPPLLQHLWSLSVEEQFYLVWPVLFSLGFAVLGGRSKHATIRRFRWIVLAGALASTALMAVLYTPFEDPSRVYYGTDTRASGILFGVALALSWIPWRLPTTVSRTYRRALTVGGFAALGGLFVILVGMSEYSPWLYRGGIALTSLLTVVVIAVIAHPAGGFGVLLANPVMKWIGTRSYGIYLWHWPIFMVTRPGIDVASNEATTFAVRLALTFAVSEVAYRYVEMPIRRVGYRVWMRGITSRLGIESLAAASSVAVGALVFVLTVVGALAWGAGSGQPGVVVASGLEGGDAVLDAAGTPQDVLGPIGPGITSDEPDVVGDFATTFTTVPADEEMPADSPRITFIGDSVLLGAESEILARFGPGTVVDGRVNRQFKHADDVARDLRRAGKLGDVVVIHLGTNGPFNSGMWDEVMTELSDVERVVVLTIYVPKRWESVVNASIASGSERWPDVEVIDFKSFGDRHPDYYNQDGVHMNAQGRKAYAEFLAEALDR